MLRKIIHKYIAVLQKLFITIVLFMLYIFGFGFTFIFVAIFNRRLLGIQKLNKETFWRDAQGYSADLNECLRES
jgi:hypothetical protein